MGEDSGGGVLRPVNIPIGEGYRRRPWDSWDGPRKAPPSRPFTKIEEQILDVFFFPYFVLQNGGWIRVGMYCVWLVLLPAKARVAGSGIRGMGRKAPPSRPSPKIQSTDFRGRSVPWSRLRYQKRSGILTAPLVLLLDLFPKLVYWIAYTMLTSTVMINCPAETGICADESANPPPIPLAE
jgi:hypothetical protein